MTPQAFSYPTVGYNNMIYVPPYGLHESIDYMIKINPINFNVVKIPLKVDSSKEKWQYGSVVGNKIIFLPYNESSILIVNCDDDSVEYVPFSLEGKGKYIKAHVHGKKVISLPYGETEYFDYACSFDTETNTIILKKLHCKINDEKKWHTSQYLNGKIYAVPRGERWFENYFPYSIELTCDTMDYTLTNMSELWKDYDEEEYTNKKYTTLARVGNKLYAPPYSENPNFDIMLKFDKEDVYEEPCAASINEIISKINQEASEYEEYLDKMKKYKKLKKYINNEEHFINDEVLVTLYGNDEFKKPEH
jgi:hypothetical protein